MHCFCQSEHRLSVPMGKGPNGPDERESILSSILSPPFHPSPLPSCCPRRLDVFFCLFVLHSLSLTITKPFFQRYGQCQTVLASTVWCLWEVVLSLLANKVPQLEELSTVTEDSMWPSVLEK